MVRPTSIVLLLLTGVSHAQAQQVLESEPPRGALKSGQIVYVDDGRCPKGQILKITGGYGQRKGGGDQTGGRREKACVWRPPGL